MKLKSRKRSRTFLYWTSVFVFAVVLGMSLQFAKAWTEPTQPAPYDNVGAPLNTSGATQTKNGQIGINTWDSQLLQGNGSLRRSIGGAAGWNPNLLYVNGWGEWGSGVSVGGPGGGSNFSVTGNSYMPIVYDSDNTGYYVDPNGTSRMNYGVYDNLYSGGWMQSTVFYDANNTSYYVDPNGTSRMNYAVYDNLYSGGWMQSPIFYDANNTNYYVDPNGTSSLASVYANDVYLRNAGKWASQVGNDNLGNHTATATLNMNGYPITNANTVYASSWMQAARYYDANDTNYYVDPNDMSWFRSVYATSSVVSYGDVVSSNSVMAKQFYIPGSGYLGRCQWSGERGIYGDSSVGCGDDVYITCTNGYVTNFRMGC